MGLVLFENYFVEEIGVLRDVYGSKCGISLKFVGVGMVKGYG